MNIHNARDNNKQDYPLTAEEVAEYLKIHPYTVRRLAREGKISGFKIGGQWRFDKKVLSGPTG